MSLSYRDVNDYRQEPIVTAILNQYPISAAKKYATPGGLAAMQRDMYAAQVQLIEHHLPTMRADDQARAARTLAWLRAQPGVVDRLLKDALQETQP